MIDKQSQGQSPDKKEVASLATMAPYRQLKQKLAQTIQSVLKTGTKALNEQKLEAYWQVGKSVTQTKLPADKIIPLLARDLSVDAVLFYRARQFFGLFPKKIPSAINQTSWTHVTEVLPLGDTKQAEFYLKLASEQGLGRDNLRKAIRKNYFALGMTEAKLKTTLKLTLDTRYCYRIKLIKVIDGDTLLIELELGFDVKVTATVRLRGINCAELRRGGVTPPDDAKQFVERVLKAATQILARTKKTDIYGRYLADIFYTPEGALEPIHLNQELLDQGLARPMAG